MEPLTDSLNFCGAVYKVATDGTSSVVHSFNGADGCNPVGELVQAPDGHLYERILRRANTDSPSRRPEPQPSSESPLPGETFEMIHAFAPFDASQ